MHYLLVNESLIIVIAHENWHLMSSRSKSCYELIVNKWLDFISNHCRNYLWAKGGYSSSLKIFKQLSVGL